MFTIDQCIRLYSIELAVLCIIVLFIFLLFIILLVCCAAAGVVVVVVVVAGAADWILFVSTIRRCSSVMFCQYN